MIAWMNHSPEVLQKWRDRIDAQRASGLTIKTFCATHSIPISSFFIWRKRLAPPPVPMTSPFVEVHVTEPPESAPAVADISAPSSPSLPAPAPASAPTGKIEIVLPDSIVIRLTGEVDSISLRRVISALRVSPPTLIEARP